MLLGAALLLASAAARSENPVARSGPYEVTLLPPAAGLFAEEEMELEFRVLDTRVLSPEGGAAPLLFARFRCEVDMPSMPSMARFDEIAHREDVPGVYGVHPTFPHGGEYRYCISLLPPAEQLAASPRPDAPFTVEFPLEVRDASEGRARRARVLPYRLEVIADGGAPAAGSDAALEIRVRIAGSPDLREVLDFDPVHERPMHLFLVRRDLAYFAHEHPELAAPGVFRLRYRFPAPGDYRLFADVAPRDAGSQVLAADISVRPGASDPPPPSPAPMSPQLWGEAGSMRVDLDPPDGGIPAGRTVTVAAHIRDRDGRPVEDIQPWLGALGHLLLVSRDGETFAHAHPDERDPSIGKAGRIPFLVRLPKPGLYKGWVQFQQSGKIFTAEVALEAKAKD